MNVDVLHSSRELFGADRSAVDIAKVLQQLGHHARIVIPAQRPERGLSALAATAGIETVTMSIAVASSRGIDGWGAVRPRRRLPRPDVSLLNTSAVLQAPVLATQRVLVLREWLEPDRLAHRLLVAIQKRRVGAVVAISEGVRRQWLRVAGDDVEVHLIPNWIDDSLIDRVIAGERSAREGIVCLGRFNHWKGQEVLADAYVEAFAGRSDRPSLTFVGAEEPGSPFHERAVRLAERGRREGWSVLPLTEDPSLIVRNGSLLVVPSLRPEPFGRVLLEGLSLGSRVLAFRGGGPDDIASVASHAVELVPRTRTELSAALTRWWSDGGHSQSPAECMRTQAVLRANFSLCAVSGLWSNLLEQVPS